MWAFDFNCLTPFFDTHSHRKGVKSNSSKAYLGIMSRIIYNISDITIKVRWKRKGLYIVKI